MGMFDKISKTLTDAGKTAAEAGKDAAEKAKTFAEVTKLNHQISQCEARMRDAYVSIGKKFYEDNKHISGTDYDDYFVQIANENMSIASLRSQISQLKGIYYCPACGAENAMENIYCCKCGAGGIRPEQPAENEEVDPSDVSVEDIKE